MRTLPNLRALTASAMLCAFLGPLGSVHANSVAYVTAHDYSGSGNPDIFGRLDVTTGTFTLISDLSLSGNTIFGMGSGAGGQIFGVASLVGPGTYPGELFSINPSSGATTDLGSLPFDPTGGASNSSGTLFTLSYSATSSLYSLNPPSNSTSSIGTVPFSPDGLLAIDPKGNLFASGNGDGSFYEVNTTNAHTTLVGNTGLTGLFAGSFVGNTLFGVSTDQSTGAESIVTIDTSNAGITQGPMIVNLPENYEITAVTASAVPEPASLVLGLIGALGVLACHLRRRHPLCF